ncbi:MAG: methionyl-tRNA formyltransferase [Bacteroidota bacterium]
MKIVFMGTPEFAVPSLALLQESGYDIVGVITATDKRGGRGGKQLLQSAVKQYALEAGLPILQPKNLKSPDFQAELRALGADLQVVVAFRMLPRAVWDMPPLGTMNLHGSLLPQYRGAAPIHWAVINGETETGATTFLLKHEIDTGDMLLQDRLPIGPEETTGEVYERLRHLGARLVLRSVQQIESNDYTLIPQDATQATKAPKIHTETCEIDFDRTTEVVHNFIRGLSPFPVAWTTLDGKKLKIYRAQKEVSKHDHPPGSWHSDYKRSFKFATRDGFIHLLDLQLQGRKRMGVVDFLNGFKRD